MKKITLSASLAIVQTLAACSPAPKPCASTSTLHNAYNGVKCDIKYTSLDTTNLSAVSIKDFGIPMAEKVRHLNELNSMPKEFIAILRAKTQVQLTAGGITNLPAYNSLRGVTPPGWPAGQTRDVVPGVGNAQYLGLGDSSLATGTNSLAMHEGGHAVAFSAGILNHPLVLQAFNKDKPGSGGTENAAYRYSNTDEYLAMAVDDYYCNSQTKARLQKEHPNAYAFVDKDYTRLLAESGVGKPDPTTKPDPIKPDPITPDPVKPDPVKPDPVKPDPTAPVPDMPDSSKPETGGTEEPDDSSGNSGTGDSNPRVDPVLKPRKSSQMCG